MKKLGFVIVIAFLVLPFHWDGYKTNLFSDQRSAHDPGMQLTNDHPASFKTSLHDSLPAEFIEDLDLGDTPGIKFLYQSRISASYFEYKADEKKLLQAMALIPHRIRDGISDTTFRVVSRNEFRSMKLLVPSAELEQMQAFWLDPDKVRDDVQIYESVKGDHAHLIVVDKIKGIIRHRISDVV